MSTEKEKQGQDVGKKDARDALKYQAKQSMDRTTEMKKDEEARRKKMKGK